ncbi:MAG: serine/threonine-protein phosphatase [Bacteroidetes bacterium]|nr:serine/threonine-protein phosphatase [Bacteroidota bacterium]
MSELATRIRRALAEKEGRAEKFASMVRLSLLVIFTIVAVLNIQAISLEATGINIAALFVGYMYGFLVVFILRYRGYRPWMKYVTSFLDVMLIISVLMLYTLIETPSVALKNYVFLAVFPAIALTVFRYDPKLTWTTGILTLALYGGCFTYLVLTGAVRVVSGGYAEELFTVNVTYIGQLTKVLLLFGFTALVAYLARYTRNLIVELVRTEVGLRLEKETMDRELELASQVQGQLLPVSVPAVQGLSMHGRVVQGHAVGGDYYDFIPLPDNSLLLIVAEVSGKGVPAALIMSEIRGSAHLLAVMRPSLEDFVRRLNSLLIRSTVPKDFATCFAAEIRPFDKTLSFVNAGHPPPFVWSEGALTPLSERTIPLGILENMPQLKTHTVSFAPGNLLVAYSDGLTERQDSRGEFYGEERLQRYILDFNQLAPQLFSDRLLYDVKTYGGDESLADDITVAVLKYQG